VDIAMRLVNTSRVSGIVTGPEAVGNLGIRLTLAENADAPMFETQAPAANTLTEASGAFTFLGVPPGQYVLRIAKVPTQIYFDANPANADAANGPTYWAQMPVVVGDSDIVGLAVALRSGLKLSGRVEFDGSSARPPQQRLLAATVSFNDLEGRAPAMPARITAEGTFVTQGLLPGRYLLSASPPGSPWVLKSITVNGKDASAMPMTIDSDATGVVVTYTDHPTAVEITVHADMGATDVPTSVVIFPANYQAWLAAGTTGRVSRFTGPVQPNAALTLSNLPAGDYFIAAVPADLAADWQDPKTLETISRGASRLQLGDGEHRTVDLRPLVIK
jgi:hypothetical protein